MAEDDQRIGVAPILDHYSLSRRILADKELIVRQLAEPDHRGRLDCQGAKPAVTLNLDLPDWIAMQKKETTGQALFMNGKLKFTGDMVLLMKLQTMM